MQNEIIYDINELLNIFDFENEQIDSKTFNKIKNLITYDVKQLISENKKDKQYYNFIRLINSLFIKLKITNDTNLSEMLKSAISNADYEKKILIELKRYLNFNRNKLNQQQLKNIMMVFVYVAVMDNNREQILSNTYGNIKIEKIDKKYQSYQETIDNGMIKIKELVKPNN